MKRFQMVGVAALHAFACVLLIAGDEDELNRLRAKAEQGSADAMIELAAAYHGGMGAPMDLEAAADWLRKAADAGAPEAHVWLGEMQETGAGVPRDLEAARQRYERAAAAGVPSANFRLGLMHFEGWSVPRDSDTALAFFRLAAEGGYVPAQRALAEILMFGIRVSKDPEDALHWAEKAALVEDADAAALIGTAYFKGLGVERDVREAREWYHESANRESSDAMLRMASTYAQGEKTAENFYETMRWLERASNSGNEKASLIFAVFLEAQAKRDPGKALKARQVINQSAEEGGSRAIEVLKLEKDGMNFSEALQYVWRVPDGDRYADNWNLKIDATTDRPPRIIRAVLPEYPVGLRVVGTDGEVVLSFIVTSRGKVVAIQILSSTHPGFEADAVAALQKWTFSPGIKDGRAVHCHMKIPVRFSMWKESKSSAMPDGKKND